VKSILMAVTEANPIVCAQPEARVRFRRLGTSSLDFEMLCWVEHPSQRGLATDELLTAVYEEFNRAGVEIPYSKQDLYIKELPKWNEADAPD
jgi:small-conductance mechanosensitive channel